LPSLLQPDLARPLKKDSFSLFSIDLASSIFGRKTKELEDQQQRKIRQE